MRIAKKITPAFVQHIALSFLLFMQNDLLTYAAAGAYGFLCSLLPVVMLVFIILIRIFRASPEILEEFFPASWTIFSSVDFTHLINSVLQVRTVGILETVITISIFWMARRFFVYVMRGFRQIFRNQLQQKAALMSILAFLSEVLLVIIISLFIFLFIVFQSLISMLHISQYIPEFLQKNSSLLMKATPYAAMFVFITAAYRFASRTKPPVKLCTVSSLCCTGIFFVISKLFQLFINMNYYNWIYGVFSNLIVLLLEVFIFFILMMFFAQLIFVYQFFDFLLFEQLYLLPPRTTMQPAEVLIRSVFMHPDHFLNAGRRIYGKDECIYTEGDASGFVYYISKGSVMRCSPNHIDYYSSGDFFGEIECLMDIPRISTVQTDSRSEIMTIPYNDFQKLLRFSHAANSKVIGMLAQYYRQPRDD